MMTQPSPAKANSASQVEAELARISGFDPLKADVPALLAMHPINGWRLRRCL